MKTFILLLLMLICYRANAQWTQLNSGTEESLNEIFFPVVDTGYVVGDNGTVLKTTDGGANWNNLNAGISLKLNELYFTTANEGWIVGDSGSVCHTTDGGAVWTCSFLDSTSEIHLHSVFALKNTVWVGGNKNFVDGYIAKTENGGISWQEADIEKYVWDIDIKKIGMVNSSTGYAVTRGDIIKTTDGGASWFITDTESVYKGDMFNVLEDLAFFPNNDTLYTCGWYGAYLGKTINGGKTWQHNTDYQNYNLDFINTQTGYVGGWGQIHKTTDGGVTFVDASGGDGVLFEDIYSIDFTDEWTGYACGARGKIIKTSNGGTTTVHQFSNPEQTVIIYPNPTNSKIHFSVQSNVHLTTVTGQVIVNTKNVNTLDLSEQPSGIYFISITNNQGQVVQRNKIVKK